MPLQRRIPKRGFTPHKRHVYQIVNVGELARVEGTTVNAQTLRDAGLIRSTKGLIKVLAMGELSQAYSVEAHKFSGGAAAKIESAGGSITTLGPAVADTAAASKATAPKDKPAGSSEPAVSSKPAVSDEPASSGEPAAVSWAVETDEPEAADEATDEPAADAEAENDG